MTVKYQRNCHGRRAGHWTLPTWPSSPALQECLQAWPASHRYKPRQLGTACSSWHRAVRQEVKRSEPNATAGYLEKTQAAVTAGPGDQSTLYHPLRKRLLCKNRVAEPLQRLLSAMVLTRSFEMHSCLHLPLTMIAYEDGYFRLTSAPFSPGGPAAPGAPRGPCKKSVNRLPD